MNKKYLWSTALFMIFLIITLPIISSNVLASLTITSVNGEDEVNGFAKAYDSVDLKVHSTETVTSDQVTITPGNDKFTSCSPSSVGGTDCDYYVPYSTMPSGANDFRVIAEGDDPVAGTLFVDDKNPVVTAIRTSSAAQQSSAAAGAAASTSSIWAQTRGNITVAFSVSHAAIGGRGCPGIKKIEFTSDSDVVATYEINQSPLTVCTYAPSIPKTFHVPGTGDKNVCVKAYDNLGHAGESCQKIFVDNDPPFVQDAKILRVPNLCKTGYKLQNAICVSTADPSITYEPQGTEMDYVSASAEDVYVQAFINDTGGLNVNSVKADLSALVDMPAYKAQLKDAAYSSVDGRVFTWKTKLSISEGGAKTIIFKAKDSVGNLMEAPVPLTITMDKSAPQIVSIKTDKCRERCIGQCSTVCYVGPGWNKIIINANEGESGLDFGNIFLDLGAFNEKYSGKQMKVAECKPGWTCEGWFEFGNKNIQAVERELLSMTADERAALQSMLMGKGVSGVTAAMVALKMVGGYAATTATGIALPVSVIAPSQDDAGNTVAGNTQASFVVDKDAPEIKEISVNAATELGRVEYYQSGDKLYISVNVSDYTPVTAVADVSRITGGSPQKGSCNYNEVTQKAVCEWEVGPILNGPLTTKIYFNVTDFVGNTAIGEKDIEILETGNESKNLWYIPDGGLVESIAPVDRAAAQVYPDPGYPVYFSVPLRTLGGSDARIMNLRIGNCVLGDSKYLFASEDPELVNNYAYGLNSAPGSNPEALVGTTGNVPPLTVRYFLSNAQMPENSVQVQCRLLITSKYRSTITLPEEENVTLQVNFYQAALGQPDQSLKDMMKGEEDWIFGAGKTLTVLKKIFGAFQFICKMLNVIIDIVNVLVNVVGLISTTSANFAEGIGVVPVLKPAAYALKVKSTGECTGAVAADQAVKKAYTILRGFCDFVSCRRTVGGYIFGDKYTNFVSDMQDMFNYGDIGYGRTAGVGGEKNVAGAGGTGAVPHGANQIEKTDVSKMFEPGNMQDSLIWNGITLCIPGIISKVDELRGIHCSYYKCLQQVPNGMPVQVCRSTRDYEECKYWYGELWSILPFAVWNRIWDTFRNIITNPLAAIQLVLGAACAAQCPLIMAEGYGGIAAASAWVCYAGEMIKMFTDVYADIRWMAKGTDMYKGYMGDSCDGIKKGIPGAEETATAPGTAAAEETPTAEGGTQ